ncbi:MAG TPA: copper resistance CopC family protein [Candidatus Limnocylindria bacterium]|nr:copper resistance CopC family protein [Candidatus Limnocylindria bacterium]
MRRNILRLTRFVAPIASAVVLLTLPAVVAAHAGLESSTPEAGANLDTAPTEVVLTFSGELDPTSAFVVTDADGTSAGAGELDLDVADRNVLSGAVDISQPGVYTVSWTAVSIDGHREDGSFEFGFRTDAAAPATDDHHDEASSPDTAMAAPGDVSAVSLIGLALLASAATLAGRRMCTVRP